jgi:hypothetical protein
MTLKHKHDYVLRMLCAHWFAGVQGWSMRQAQQLSLVSKLTGTYQTSREEPLSQLHLMAPLHASGWLSTSRGIPSHNSCSTQSPCNHTSTQHGA